MNIKEFWKAVLAQDEKNIRKYFHKEAYVNWHCTNEHFTVDEYIIANCEYPGEWDGVVERMETLNDLIITVTHIYLKDRSVSFHVTSFIQIKEDKITAMDEYYADDGMANHRESAPVRIGSSRIKMPLMTSPRATDTMNAAVGFMIA